MSDRPNPTHIPPQGSPWWENLAERRLDEITRRLTEVASHLAEVAKDLRSQTRVSDQHGSTLLRLEERLRDVETDLRDFPKKLDRLASQEWMGRLETRLSNIEDEARSPFVRKSEFDPVRKSVFTVIGAICLGVLGAVAKLVMK